MKYPISLTLFFPVYNEEENIRELIEHAVQIVEQSPYIRDYEILIIDDGSTDATPSLTDKLAEAYPRAHAIHHPKNRGYGAALRTGIANATKDYIFFTDGDLQFDIRELNNLIVHLEDYGDMVVGYRAPRRDPFMRRLNAFGWNVLNRLLFGLRIRDIDCAFKLFRREIVQKLRLRSRSAMINAEILIRLKRAGIEVKEVPVSHLPRKRGDATGARPSVILRALREMADLYRGDLGSATQKQALKFAGVGTLNTLIDMGLYVVLTRALSITALLFAKFLSFMAGTISSLLLNRSWTFGLRTRITAGELARFYVMVSISLVANLSAMFLFVRVGGLPDLVGLVLATGVSLTASYVLSRFWVFAKRPPRIAFPRALLVLLMCASMLLPLWHVTRANAQDKANHREQQSQENKQAAAARIEPSRPVQPMFPTHMFDPFPFYPTPTPAATTTPVLQATTSPPSQATTTSAATSTAAATAEPPAGTPRTTTDTLPTTNKGGVPAAPSRSPLTSITEKLFPGSPYPADHLSLATTRRFMLLAGVSATAGVLFLLYGTVAALAARRAERRQFRRLPIAAN